MKRLVRIRKKIDLVEAMAQGLVFTALGPAERSALRHVLDLLEQSDYMLDELADALPCSLDELFDDEEE